MLDHPSQLAIARRQFLGTSCAGVGTAALASLLGTRAQAAAGLPGFPNFPPKARRVIWLTQAGAPSQIDLFDHKPNLKDQFDKDLPASIRQGQRLTGMTSGQSRFPIAPSLFTFKQHGASGIWMSDLLPHTAKIADDLCVIKSLHTEAINHDPAMTMLQTGHQIAGRPSLGAWVAYGLGDENANLPAFVVMISRPTGPTNAQPLHERMWGAGFLPTRHQGVRFSPGRDPVLYLSDPPGVTREQRREFLDTLGGLNRMTFDAFHDPETAARIDQFEMAFRMQAAVPELADLSTETASTFEKYGPESKKPGSYAANCILARRLAERGVRFVQLYHRGWDQHNNCPAGLKTQCYDTDQASAALVSDLKERGLLDDTLVVWGGEFGRTVFSQGTLTATDYGRDHHPRCFTVWMAGAGVKAGMTYGETDDYSYNIVKDPVHIHDLNATTLHLLGIEHTKLTYRFAGRDYRLTDVHGNVVKDILT
ncbi:MAG: DUF1501 domain-containing protein [Planctomycetia bacterium]|nr:DUF1501 domain-containing protein [Planctomycetia bacterium]